MSKQIVNQGGSLVVVDKVGRLLEPDSWPTAKVFRSGNQENLLVVDNRSRDYQISRFKRRKKLAMLAWGQESPATNQQFVKRWLEKRNYMNGGF